MTDRLTILFATLLVLAAPVAAREMTDARCRTGEKCAMRGSFATLRTTAKDGQQQFRVALTIDDLPAHGPLAPGQRRPEVMASILATLRRESMPPTYGFVNGFRLEDYPYQLHILEAWRRAGQPVGNHTYGHEEPDTETLAAFERDVQRDEPLLRRLDPADNWHWFRFPYMEEGNTAAKREGARAFLAQRGYRIAEVSLSFEDARWNDAYGRCAFVHDEAAVQALHDSYLAAADQALSEARALSQQLYQRDIAYILLLHAGAFDARMLPELLALLRARGASFITLPEAANDEAYAEDAVAALPPVRGGATLLDMQARARGVVAPSRLPAIFAAADAACAGSGAHIPAR